jgi:hypothetical protein
VQVSYGLLADIRVNDKYGPGELAASPGETRVRVTVLGPSWSTVDVVELYANGRKVRETGIAKGDTPGVKWSGTWTLPQVPYDRCLVAVARGPGIKSLHWPTAKAYQPDSPDWTPHVLAVTGAVWIDGDGNTRKTPAIDYARAIVQAHKSDLAALLEHLDAYDEAVAAQAASLLHPALVNLHDEQSQRLLRTSSPAVQRGIRKFLDAWRETQLARAQE